MGLESSDIRYQTLEALALLGPQLLRDPVLAGEVVEACKSAVGDDPNHCVRYHAVRALGRLGPDINKVTPELIPTLSQAVARALTSDPFERVRRGAVHAMLELSVIDDRKEMIIQLREACAKAMEVETYDVVRADAATVLGILGVPAKTMQNKNLLRAFEAAIKDDTSELVRLVTHFALVKIGKIDRATLNENRISGDLGHMAKVEKFLMLKNHWSYWKERECLAKAFGQMGPNLWSGSMPKVVKQICVLLEEFALHNVFDLRAAACKALGELMPLYQCAGIEVFINALHSVAFPTLRMCLEDNHEEVRDAAQTALVRVSKDPIDARVLQKLREKEAHDAAKAEMEAKADMVRQISK